MDFNRNLRIVRTSGSSYPLQYKSNVLWVHHDGNNNPIAEIWDHGKWVPVGSGDIVIDTEMSDSSSNAIANKTVKKYVDGIASKTDASILSLNEGVVELKTLTAGHTKSIEDLGIAKQDALISGTNIKTINGVPVLGSGDIKTPAPTKVSELENGSTVTYSGENDAIYVANSGKEITNLKVTCTTPADPVNPTMDSLKTREAKFMFECGPYAAITFENVQWNDWDAPDFNTASHCICEISIMYVSGLKKFIGRYTTYPPTHLTPPSWSLEDYTTFGANDSPYIEVTDNDDVGWKAEYPDWMSAEGGIDSGTGSGGISFQCTNDGAARDGYMTLKSADGRKVFVKCYVMQEGVQS